MNIHRKLTLAGIEMRGEHGIMRADGGNADGKLVSDHNPLACGLLASVESEKDQGSRSDTS